ncbi:MAG: Imm50 family immunity protein [Planctomycetota bacterium]
MTEISKRIINSNLLIDWFGYWHDFHDFEVMHIDMNRKGPTIIMQVYGFKMLPEVDEKGYYKLTKHCVITIKFNEVSDLSLEEFNHQNVLASLSFNEEKDSIRTALWPCYGCHGFIVSRNVEVVNINPIKE